MRKTKERRIMTCWKENVVVVEDNMRRKQVTEVKKMEAEWKQRDKGKLGRVEHGERRMAEEGRGNKRLSNSVRRN